MSDGTTPTRIIRAYQYGSNSGALNYTAGNPLVGGNLNGTTNGLTLGGYTVRLMCVNVWGAHS